MRSDFYSFVWNVDNGIEHSKESNKIFSIYFKVNMEKPKHIKVYWPFHEIENVINLVEYDLYTKDNLRLCITMRRDETDMWRWTLYLIRFPEWNNVLLRETETTLQLKECLSYFNEWIKNNFKTTLDKEVIFEKEF